MEVAVGVGKGSVAGVQRVHSPRRSRDGHNRHDGDFVGHKSRDAGYDVVQRTRRRVVGRRRNPPQARGIGKHDPRCARRDMFKERGPQRQQRMIDDGQHTRSLLLQVERVAFEFRHQQPFVDRLVARP